MGRADDAVEDPTPVNFIELDVMPTTECTVEMEKPDGAKMRVSIKGRNGVDIIELGKAFWSTR